MQEVVPTPVGVFLDHENCDGFEYSRPHARGGVSKETIIGFVVGVSSPRPWGCFPSEPPSPESPGVVPTPVGVFLNLQRIVMRMDCRPHARGGVSVVQSRSFVSVESSPRPWGCF